MMKGLRIVGILALAFAITWAIVITSWSFGLHENPQTAGYTLAAEHAFLPKQYFLIFQPAATIHR